MTTRCVWGGLLVTLVLTGCASEVEDPRGPKLGEVDERVYGDLELPRGHHGDTHPTEPSTPRDPREPGDPVGTMGLLMGAWELVGTEDGFDVRKPVPPGTFISIEEDDWYGPVVRFGCDGEVVPFYTDGGTVVMQAGYYELQWTILELLEDRFTFLEGHDVFYYEQRDECPIETKPEEPTDF